MGTDRIRRDRTLLAPGQEFANRSLTEAEKGYTRADFRAKRESLGMTVHDVALALNIDERNINRWERGLPGKDAMPADFAWRLLDDYEALFGPTVDLIYSDAIAEQGDEDEIVLRYWRTQTEFSDAAGENRSFAFRNACTRAAARRLRDDGFAVALRFEREEPMEYVFDDDLSQSE